MGPTIARTIRTHIKNMATLLNARRSPTVRLLSGIGSSMSFCQRTGPQKTMTKKQNGPADCSASPFTFLWCEGENRFLFYLFIIIEIKNIKNFHTNVSTNKLELLPEFWSERPCLESCTAGLYLSLAASNSACYDWEQMPRNRKECLILPYP